MKLSEAIRQGAKQHPQCFYTLFEHDEHGQKITGSCALGAALVALCPTSDLDRAGVLTLDSKLNIDLDQRVQHPLKPYSNKLVEVITDLNDHRHWSREQIADWLEGIGY